uniref:FAF domain-containing protein n=1 Tax=Leersia perrieri TaxID=77586 RepID=A0A0D9VL37_9ORYZ
MLLSVSPSDKRSSCRDRDCLGVGLRSLLVPDAVPAAHIVTRSVVALRSRVEGTTSRDEGECIDDEEEDGFWVAYGRQGRLRRLPPRLPSLRGALRRARTGDGRLVITEAPAGARRRHEYIRVQRGGGRLTMQLVESNDFHPLPSAAAATSPSQEEEEDDDEIVAVREVNDTSTAQEGEGTFAMRAINDTSTAVAVGEGVRGHMQEEAAAPMPALTPPAIGCFEDVVKYHSIGNTSLHQILRARMVH